MWLFVYNVNYTCGYIFMDCGSACEEVILVLCTPTLQKCSSQYLNNHHYYRVKIYDYWFLLLWYHYMKYLKYHIFKVKYVCIVADLAASFLTCRALLSVVL
jgi:hypothetical protein